MKNMNLNHEFQLAFSVIWIEYGTWPCIVTNLLLQAFLASGWLELKFLAIKCVLPPQMHFSSFLMKSLYRVLDKLHC